jgi:hypothetical protein
MKVILPRILVIADIFAVNYLKACVHFNIKGQGATNESVPFSFDRIDFRYSDRFNLWIFLYETMSIYEICLITIPVISLG